MSDGGQPFVSSLDWHREFATFKALVKSVHAAQYVPVLQASTNNSLGTEVPETSVGEWADDLSHAQYDAKFEPGRRGTCSSFRPRETAACVCRHSVIGSGRMLVCTIPLHRLDSSTSSTLRDAPNAAQQITFLIDELAVCVLWGSKRRQSLA